MTFLLPNVPLSIGQGFSVNGNPPLNSTWMLPILHQDNKPANAELIFRTCVGYIVTVLAKENSTDDLGINRMIAGVAVMLNYGLIGYRLEKFGNNREMLIPDGYWKTTDKPIEIPKEWLEKMEDIITPENMKNALRIITVKKAIWWSGRDLEVREEYKDIWRWYRENDYFEIAAHSLESWASTIKFLSIAGIGSLKPYEPVVKPKDFDLHLPNIAQEHFRFLPRGADKHYLAYEGAKSIVGSDLAKFCPNVKNFIFIAKERETILSDPALYHTDSEYLTGRSANFSDSSADKYLGRVGAYVQSILESSYLHRSSHLWSSKLGDYKDYDREYEKLLEWLRYNGHKKETLDAARIRSSDADIEEVKKYFYPEESSVSTQESQTEKPGKGSASEVADAA